MPGQGGVRAGKVHAGGKRQGCAGRVGALDKEGQGHEMHARNDARSPGVHAACSTLLNGLAPLRDRLLTANASLPDPAILDLQPSQRPASSVQRVTLRTPAGPARARQIMRRYEAPTAPLGLTLSCNHACQPLHCRLKALQGFRACHACRAFRCLSPLIADKPGRSPSSCKQTTSLDRLDTNTHGVRGY